MKINWIGPINILGYGIASLHCVDELIKAGHEVALFPIGQPQCHFRHQDNIKQALKNADSWDNSATCIRMWHQHDMSMFVGKGRHIGFPIFELDTFTDKEKHHLSSCDELFVCSNWAKSIISENGINIPTSVIPLGVDNEVFTPKMSQRSPTIFLNVGKWEIRKGHDILIQAFNRAFKADDKVELWMMCDNPFLNEEQTQEWRKLYSCSNLGNKVRFIPRVEADSQVAEIMQQADCGVFPSRAEGWNLEALEMLACGKQVIATDYSAHTEFLTNENSWRVPTYGVEPAYDGIWFHKQGGWAAFVDKTTTNDHNGTTNKLIQHMRYVHELKQTGGLGLNKIGLETAQRFSWTNTASSIIQQLS